MTAPASTPAAIAGRAETIESTAHAPLASSALWLLGSNLSYSACQWATVAVLAKIGPANGLGHFGLALAVVTPVVVVSNLSLRSYQATDVMRRYTFADYMNLRVLANLAAGAVIALAALVAGIDGPTGAILAPLAVGKLAEATSETCYGCAQRHDRMRFVALARAIRGAGGLAALIAVVGLGGSLAAGTWALAAAWTGFLLAVELPAAHALEPAFARPHVARLRRLASECSSLGVLNGLVALNQSIPRYILQAAYGAAAVGYFTALAGVGPAVSQLAAAVGHAAAPRLGRAAGDGRRFRALVLRLLGTTAIAGAVLVLGTAAVGRPFLALAYAPDYATYQPAFVLLVAAAGLWAINMLSYFALLAMRRSVLQIVIQVLGIAVTVGTGLWLVPTYGVVGGAAATALSGFAMAAVNLWTLLRARRTP
jgi:O-antigen/teichoic acid export membrane protein